MKYCSGCGKDLTPDFGDDKSFSVCFSCLGNIYLSDGDINSLGQCCFCGGE